MGQENQRDHSYRYDMAGLKDNASIVDISNMVSRYFGWTIHTKQRRASVFDEQTE
jgi:hypothetical protein